MALIWNELDTLLVQKYLHRYVKAGKLYQIRRGIYARDKNCDPMELATRIYTPAYISLETVLTREGVVFQHYDRIFVISYLSREILCDGRIYVFRKIKNNILINPLGIQKGRNYHIASKERAFLDTIYLNPGYHFDNLSSIDWEKCFAMVSIYDNKAMEKRLYSYYQLEKTQSSC